MVVDEALVVDASVAAKWHLRDEEDADKAVLLFDRFIAGDVALWAPSHIRYEVPAVIAHASIGRHARFSREVALESIAAFLALGIETVETTALILAAVSLVHEHAIAFYDSVYLALALRLELPFITADRRLYQRLPQDSTTVWLGDYA